MRYAALISFLACIPIANWLIGNVGTKCIPDGPCLIPVGMGYLAPSGVTVIGAALVLRDVVQSEFGSRVTLAAIVAGAGISAIIAPPALVIASATAFLLSELADMAVYTPLRKRWLGLAVLASGVIGAAVDSAAFLLIAFGSLQYIEGQIIGKLWASAFAFVAILAIRRSRAV